MKDDIFMKRKEEFLKIAKELSELFYKKNKDYNDAYFKKDIEGYNIDKKLKEIDFYLNIKRKFIRLANFAEKRLFDENFKNEVADETEEDTIRDIAIYCIMELIKRGEGKLKK